MSKNFSELGISEDLIARLNEIKITEPTKVQESVLPHIAEGKNVIFQSETGTGKTFAFLLPLLQKIEGLANPKKEVLITIISPTFELASQLKSAAASVTKLKSALFIGGAPLKRQIETLKEHPSIVIGTPARLLELVRLKKLKITDCAAAVFDEADRLFSKEIASETSDLAGLFGKDTQFIACSATINDKTKKMIEDAVNLANRETDKNFEVILLPPEEVLRTKIEHWAFYCERREKIDFLRSLLHAVTPKKALVFTCRADQVENISQKLKFKKINCEGLHARTKNQERQSILARFKSGKISILVTSDLSSRGLDIPDIDYVIQTDLPSDDDFFVHRSGRTARAGKCGVNIVIGDEYELRHLAQLEKKLGIVINPKALYKGKVVKPEQIAGATE